MQQNIHYLVLQLPVKRENIVESSNVIHDYSDWTSVANLSNQVNGDTSTI